MKFPPNPLCAHALVQSMAPGRAGRTMTVRADGVNRVVGAAAAEEL